MQSSVLETPVIRLFIMENINVREYPEPQATDDAFNRNAELSPFLPSNGKDRTNETALSRHRSVIALILLLSCGLSIWAVWASQPSDREELHLPHATVEVWGMS